MINKKKVIFLICWLALLLCNTQLSAAQEAASVDLTPEEKQWLQAHRTLKVTAASMPPYAFMENGKVQGYTIDLIKKMARKIGATAKFTVTSMKKTHQAIKDGRAQIILNQGYTKQKEQYLSFSGPFVKVKFAIFSRKSRKGLNDLKSLQGKAIAGPSGYFLFAVLQKKYPKINIIHSKDLADALRMVSDGKADAAIMEQSLGQYLLAKLFFMNLHIGGFAKPFGNKMLRAHYWAVAKDLPILETILDKAYKSLNVGEKQRLWDHWFQSDPHKEVMPDTTKKLKLTNIEKAWLEKHPVIRVHNEWNWPPFNYNKDGKPTGFSIEYMNLLADRIGIKTKYIPGEWGELLDQAFDKKLDVMLNIVKTPERQKHLLYTDTYAKNPNVIIAREESSITDTQSLFGKKVAYPEGFFYDEVLRTEFPEIIRVPTKDMLETLEAIQYGKVDAALGELAVMNYLIRENLLTGLAIKGPFKSGNTEIEKLNIAVRNDWPELVTILDKALLSVTPEEYRRLTERWISSGLPKAELSDEEEIRLTKAERTWLAEHRVLRLGANPAWPPYDFLDVSGKQRGFAADLFDLLSKRLDISFNLVPDLTWPQVLKAARERHLDVVSILSETPERAEYLKFSTRLLRNPWVIVTKKGFRSVKSLGDMTQEKIAMGKSYAIVELSREAFPNLSITMVESPLTGLEAVMSGQVDAYVGNLGVVSYLIQQNGLTTLKINATAGVKPQSLHMGVRSDWPELVSILNKGLASISKEELNAIYKRWIPVKMTTPKSQADFPISFRRVAAYVLVAFAAIFLLAWVFLKLGKKERILAGFGSRRFRYVVIAGLSFFVIVVSFLGWFALTRIKSAILQDVEEVLKTVLLVSEERLDGWEADRKAFMKQLGRDPQLVHLVEDLLKVPANPEALLSSKPLGDVRHYFKSNKDIFANMGFFIINPQDISIGSMRNANVGTQNLIARKYPKYIKKAFDGEVSFVPPMDSDVQLGKASGSKGERKPPTMFFIGPVQNAAGKIIAVMTLRIDPSRDFSRVLDMSLRGSQQTYAFDYLGRLITNSKFDAQLRQIGLIGKEQRAALNIEIRDPGGNMLGGYQPTTQRDNLPLTRAAAGAIALKSKMEEVGATFGHSDIGVEINGYRDYRGVPVFGAWVWDKNLELGVTVEIDMGDALSNYYQIRFIILAVLGLTLILFVCSTLFVLAMGERTNRSLTKAKDTLEDKVEERTAELRDRQEELRSAEVRSRLLLESAGEGIFGVDTHGLCTFANPAALSILGYTLEEIVSQNIHGLIHHTRTDGTSYPVETCPMFKAFTEGKADTVNDEMLWSKDGTGIHVEYTATPIELDREITGAVITFRDISVRKQQEEALDRSQRELTQLLDTAPFAITVNREVDDHFVTEQINQRFIDLFGYTMEDVPGVDTRFIKMYPDPEYRQVVLESWKERLAAAERGNTLIEPLECEVTCKDGQIRIVEWSGTILADRHITMGLDITERKEAENNLNTRLDELARFRQLAFGREEKMIELKKEINEILNKYGLPDKYKIR